MFLSTRWDIIGINIGVILGIGVGIGVIGAITIFLNMISIAKMANRLKYDKVLKKGKKLKKFFWILNNADMNLVCLLIAMAHFAKGNISEFLIEINKVSHKGMIAIKHYFKTMMFFIENDIDKAKKEYLLFTNSYKRLYRGYICFRSFDYYDDILTAIFNYYDGNYALSKCKLDEIYPDIKNPILLIFFDKILCDINQKLNLDNDINQLVLS